MLPRESAGLSPGSTAGIIQPAMMHTLAAVLFLGLFPLGSWTAQDSGRAQAKPVWPRNAGVYAMTAQGPLGLKISGERSAVDKALGLKVIYSSRDLDRIPVADTVQSFFVNMADWTPKDLYMVVGRDRLTDPLTKYQRLSARAVTRGVVAFEIVSTDLEPAFLLRAIRRLTPAGVADADIEAYVVLELKNAAGLNDRSYPVRITVPKKQSAARLY